MIDTSKILTNVIQSRINTNNIFKDGKKAFFQSKLSDYKLFQIFT